MRRCGSLVFAFPFSNRFHFFLYQIAILATAREAQRQGIGYQLTVHSLRLARDLGFDVARMDCTNEYR